MRVGTIILVKFATFLIVLSLGLPLPLQAGTFWQDGFENPMTPNWDTSACSGGAVNPGPQNGCNPRISTTIAHSGSRSLMADYSQCPTQTTGYGCGTFMDRTHPATTEVWTRFYSYTAPGFQYWPTNEAKRFFHKATNVTSDIIQDHWYGNPAGGFSTEQQVTNTGAPCKPNDSACIYGPNVGSVPLNNGQWYCIETHVKNNTAGQANGTLEMWVNGTQTVGYYNRELFGKDDNGVVIPIPQFSILRLYTQNSIGLMYYDDFAVGDTRIGCSISAIDTIPPSTPSGLIIR